MSATMTATMASNWTWPMMPVKRTKGVACRFLIGTFSLQPLPGGKPVELRLYLKQWDLTAAEPGSWCTDLMKWSGNVAGGRMSPFKPFQHVQVSQRDWAAFYAAWGADGVAVMDLLEGIAGPLALSAD